MRNRMILWAVLLIAAFLAGFLPSYIRANRLDSEVTASRRLIQELRLRNAIDLTYVEASQKNYGIAQESATRFFVEARNLAARADNPDLKKSLEELAGAQNSVSSKMAQSDPSVVNDLADLVRKTRQLTPGAP